MDIGYFPCSTISPICFQKDNLPNKKTCKLYIYIILFIHTVLYEKQKMLSKLTVNTIKQSQIVNQPNWVDIVKVNDEQDVTSHYLNICQKHANEKRWILLVNPEEETLEPLSKNSVVDTSRILRVNSANLDEHIANIESALSKGNCAAIVINNAQVDAGTINHLNECAMQGKTRCLVLQSSPLLH